MLRSTLARAEPGVLIFPMRLLRNCTFAVLIAAGALLALTRITEPLELRVLDFQFELLRTWFPRPAPEIVVVGIDHESLERIPEPFALWHRHFSAFLSALTAAKPLVVGLDVVLPDRSFEAIVPNTDKQLIKGLLDARRSYPLVLALTIDPAGGTRKIHPPFLGVAGPDSSGYALFPLDGDGVVRRFDEHLDDQGKSVPTLVGQMVRRLGRPVSHGYIDYSRGAAFHYVPMHRVIEWTESGDGATLQRQFQGKPVLMGIIERFNDRRVASVRLAAWDQDVPDVPGVLINAQALRNLLDSGFAQRIDQGWIALAAGLAALTWLVSASAAVVTLLGLALVTALFSLSTWLLHEGTVAPPVAVSLAIVMGLAVRHGWDTAERLVERRRLRASFGGYVSPSVMDEILSGHLQPELGGVEKFVCVLFSDIRSYTTRSEGMTAPEVVAFLNRYFDRVVQRIHAHDGAVICFMGDGIMAVFGAAKPLPNPCQSAFDAALGLIENAAELNREFAAEHKPPIDIGVGLHAGHAVVGHIGSRDRHDYSAVGDVTNVASRLESLTKEKSYRLIVSSTVAEQLDRNPGMVDLGALEIRGHTPVGAFGYDPVGAATLADSERTATAEAAMPGARRA
jgi:class 3 adenylate cyclase/CHASE2 domain-containing sensor protein